MNMEGVNHGLV